MRKPAQTRKAIADDLKHFSTALDRAKDNTTRPKKKNARIVALLSELVREFTNEKLDDISNSTLKSA